MVVVVAPQGQLAACIGQGKEDFYVQALIAQPAVKRFDVAVLDRAPWPDEVQMYSVLVGPQVHCLASEFGPVIDGDRLWRASQRSDLVQCRCHLLATQRGIGEQGQALREYCERGGFFMADDFHGDAEYAEFQSRMTKAFPNHPIEDIPDDDPIFHTVYDIKDKIQIPGWEHLRDGHKNGITGIGAHWRAIRDDKGRVMVAISYNSDVGDSWEYADDPRYPAKFSDQSIRMGVNYIVYSMTH